jgi:hypothetical protein
MLKGIIIANILSEYSLSNAHGRSQNSPLPDIKVWYTPFCNISNHNIIVAITIDISCNVYGIFTLHPDRGLVSGVSEKVLSPELTSGWFS